MWQIVWGVLGFKSVLGLKAGFYFVDEIWRFSVIQEGCAVPDGQLAKNFLIISV